MSDFILVTGAAGYIGGQTVLRLKDMGHKVVALDTRASPHYLLGIPDRFYQEDFSKPHALELLDKFAPRVIIQCAGTSLVGPSVTDPERYYNNNFVKTKILLDRIREIKLKTRFIFSSSAAVYGNPVMVPCQEPDPLLPISPYGESKLMIEMMLRAYNRAYDQDYVSFRYFNACGADSQSRHGQSKGATHIMARILESLRDDREFVLNGDNYPTPDGTCIRDYIHVDDIANAHVMAMDESVLKGEYNLGNSQGISNMEIICAAQKITGRQLRKLHRGEPRAGDPAVLTASSELFKSVSSWIPKYGMDEMLGHAWAWYNH